MGAATVTIDGKRFVILPETEYERLRGGPPGGEPKLPPLPKQQPNGNYPAIEYARAVTARDIILARRRLGLSQLELARRSGVRAETLSRIERAKMTPSVATMQKIDRVLTKLGS
ncbi:MAG: helix-turn-helix transcriptional regulator [Tepidisphaeraceae bacterium]|jgi:DNA-binding XRE family transcriptional regulator